MPPPKSTLEKVINSFRPGGAMDDVSRLFTPGGTQNPPDPFYMHRIARGMNEGIQTQTAPGVDLAQQMAARYQDPQTLASTLGIKSFKHGGRVKQTGIYQLHRGEHVMTRRQMERVHKLVQVMNRRRNG